MTVQMFTFLTLDDDIIGLLITDCLLMVVALLFVFGYFVFNLGSCYLAAIGVSIIFLSFPATIFVVNLIFQMKYFGSL